jgi:hypothetical protein
MNENEDNLTVWMLTLPGIEGTEPKDELDLNHLNPDLWPGGWTHFQNANAMVVAAVTEQDARDMAAQDDCPIWKDPLYARCRVMLAKEEGVIFMVRSGADNE